VILKTPGINVGKMSHVGKIVHSEERHTSGEEIKIVLHFSGEKAQVYIPIVFHYISLITLMQKYVKLDSKVNIGC
jgi:hypothetical protein